MLLVCISIGACMYVGICACVCVKTCVYVWTHSLTFICVSACISLLVCVYLKNTFTDSFLFAHTYNGFWYCVIHISILCLRILSHACSSVFSRVLRQTRMHALANVEAHPLVQTLILVCKGFPLHFPCKKRYKNFPWNKWYAFRIDIPAACVTLGLYRSLIRLCNVPWNIPM